jgi:hypothetical protein
MQCQVFETKIYEVGVSKRIWALSFFAPSRLWLPSRFPKMSDWMQSQRC